MRNQQIDFHGKKIPRLTLAVLLLAILGVGAFFAWWMVSRADRELRADLLHQTKLLGQALNVEHIQALSGSEADLANPHYQRLKEQLAAVPSANPLFRFLYLLGRKEDGALFFFMDSEPATSECYSLPGQIYTEAPESFRRAFGARTELVEGPYTDRWGKWVSVLVPILDPQTVMYGLATTEDAQAMVRKAVGFYKKNGRESLLKEINNPQGEFHKGDLYAFVYDRNMTWLAHPVKPELVGQNWIDRKDWPGGKYFRKEIQEVARTKGSGWVEFEYENPINGQHDHKTTYVESLDDLILCAGAYKGDGEILAVMGMDINARTWNGMLAQAALPPVLFALALMTILLAGWTLAAWRSRLSGRPLHWMRHLEPALVVAVGLVVTLCAAWLAHEREKHDRKEAFVQLAASRTQAIAETLHDLRSTQLEGLAHFYENSSTMTSEEFRQYTAYLTKNPAIQAWEWIPAVPAAEKSHFEEEARAEGWKDFEIWQKNEQGKRVPASGRDVYYPVFQVAPLAGNERAVGYDLGSEPLRRAALEEATRTGLSTATYPITLVQEPGTQKGMLLCRPVFGGDNPKQLRGFTLAVLRMGTLLKSAGLDKSAPMDISLLHKDAVPKSLATTWDDVPPPASGLVAARPVFAFDKAFSVTAHAGPEFMRLHPLREGWLTALTGLLITAAMTVVISVILRRREQLERLVAERTASLRESENQLIEAKELASQKAALLGSIMESPHGVIIFSLDREYRYTSFTISHKETIQKIWGVEIAVGMNMLDAISDPCDREKAKRSFDRALQGEHLLMAEEYGEAALYRTFYENRYSPILDMDGAVSGLTVFVIDITERKRAEEALKKRMVALTQPLDNAAELLFSDLFDIESIQRLQDQFAKATGVASIITKPDGTPLTHPSHFCRLCIEVIRKTEKGRCNCFKSDAALGRHSASGPIIQPCLSGGLWDAGASITVGGKHIANWLIGQVRNETQDEETMLRYADEIGADRATFRQALAEVTVMSRERFEQIAQALFTLAGELSSRAYQNIQQARFITERKRTEEMLRESEARYAQLAEQSSTIAWEVDTQGLYTYVSKVSEAVLGYRPDELMRRKHFYDLHPESGREAFKASVFARKEPFNNFVNAMQAKDGRQVWVSTNGAPILNAEGALCGYRGSYTDITERKAMEEKLLRTQRMESMGTLAAGVAHDLNNILTPIILSAEMLHASEDDESRECLISSIEECAMRGAAVVNQVLTFARGTKGERTALQLNRLVDDTGKIARETFPKNVAITSSVPTDIWPVKGDSTQIHQVLLNLCINARDAMPEGGTLHISVENTEVDQNFAAMVPEAKAGDFAVLAVTDSGMGIPREMIAKIFEPFFTTKEVGKGTGLGLSTVIGIVRSHGGFVTVESKVGRGSTFKVFLPRETEGTAEQKPSPPPQMPQNGKATILVVDDEITIAKTLSMVLENKGYKVLTAFDGNEALPLYREHANEIDLVLTDVMMPGMDGVALSRALKKINPQVKILASTGQASETRQDELHALGVDVILHKPYDAKNLLAALHTAIHAE